MEEQRQGDASTEERIDEMQLTTLSGVNKARILEMNALLRGESAAASYEDLLAEMNDASHRIIGVYQGETIVGMIALHDVGEGHIWIRHNVVHPDAGRQGIGKRMFLEALSRAQRLGAQTIHLHCKNIPERDAARKIYLDAGFTNITNGPLGSLDEYVLMVRA
jgi:GNAT superfamily N-acetyltransferase